jgi:hypothetical protein
MFYQVAETLPTTSPASRNASSGAPVPPSHPRSRGLRRGGEAVELCRWHMLVIWRTYANMIHSPWTGAHPKLHGSQRQGGQEEESQESQEDCTSIVERWQR